MHARLLKVISVIFACYVIEQCSNECIVAYCSLQSLALLYEPSAFVLLQVLSEIGVQAGTDAFGDYPAPQPAGH